MSYIETAQSIAEALVRIGAVKPDVKHPVPFKAGFLSPVYVDNRQVPFHPQEWERTVKGFGELINELRLMFDV